MGAFGAIVGLRTGVQQRSTGDGSPNAAPPAGAVSVAVTIIHEACCSGVLHACFLPHVTSDGRSTPGKRQQPRSGGTRTGQLPAVFDGASARRKHRCPMMYSWMVEQTTVHQRAELWREQ